MNKSFSIEMEQSVLGCIIRNEGSVDLVSDFLTVDSFYSLEHKDIYTAIVKNLRDGKGTDIVSISETLEQSHGDNKFAYLGEMANNYPSEHSILSHAKVIVQKRKEREMIAALDSAKQAIQSGDHSTHDALSIAIANVSAVDPDDETSDSGAQHVKDIGVDWVDIYEQRIENPDKQGLTLGIYDLDQIIGLRGQQPGDVVVIAGRPKMGKSLLSVKIADHIALELKKPVVNFSMEMTKNLNYERILTQETGISNESFYRVLDDDNWGRVSSAIVGLNKSEYWIDDRPNLSFNKLRSEARKLSKLYGGYKGLGAIFIDYFTLMDIGDGVKNASFEYANLSKQVTALAKELGCPIFLLAQLNRDCEKRADKRPMPSDLGDTGQLERDASLIIMLYREEVYQPDTPMKGLTELIISVNRNGDTGSGYQTMVNGRFGDIDASKAGAMVAEAEYQSKQSKENTGFKR